MNAIEERVDARVAEVLSTAPDRRFEKIWQIHAESLSGDDPVLPVRVANGLRKCGEYDWSEYTLGIALRVPDQRKLALFELSVTSSMRDDPAAALRYIETLRKEATLNSYQLRHAAIQHARCGDFDAAKRVIHDMAVADYKWQGEALITLQFCEYLRLFPRERAIQDLETLSSKYQFAPVDKVEAAIAEAIRRSMPFLLLRTGDGEGTFTRVSLEDESQFGLLYRVNRKEFLARWFSPNNPIDDVEFEKAWRGYDRALELADYWAGFHAAGIRQEYRIASRRGVAAVVNIIRRAQLQAESRPHDQNAQFLCDPTIHYSLLLSGALKRVLAGLDEIWLITCHTELPTRLAADYGIKSIRLFKVPGERSRKEHLGESAVEGVHFPNRFAQLSAELKSKVLPGTVCLVAAGFLGKVYCGIIKEKGGVALDIGAVADIWMGRATRTFPPGAANHVLNAT